MTNFERYFIGFGTCLGLINGHYVLAAVIVAIAIFIEVTPDRLPSSSDKEGNQ